MRTNKDQPMSKSALLFISLLLGCAEEGPQIDVESSTPVRVETVTRRPIREYITATGTVQATHELSLRSSQSGYYQLQENPRSGLPFAMGDPILAGEIICRFENPEFINQLTLDSKELQYTTSERNYNKQKILYEKGGITLYELTEAERRFIDARYARENAQLQLTKLTVRAPFKGMLVDLTHYTPNQWLDAGAPLGQLMDYAQLYAEISLPGKEIDHIFPEQQVLVTYYSSTDTLFGAIAQVSPVLNSDSRMFKAKLTIDNAALKLRPGMFVKVDIVVAAKDSALVIPKDIVLERDSDKTVFIVEKGVALERKIATGLNSKNDIEVLSGLDEGERLIVEGFETLRNRSKIKVVE